MVSTEHGLPDSFDPVTGKNIKWSAQIGTETHSTPIVAGGRVYIGTNNGEPRDPKHQGDRGVMMCFDEKTGQLLWQLVVPKREEDVYFDWPKSGIASPATVEGDRVYLVSNRGEVMCLDVRGMANGNDGPFHEEGTHMTFREPQGTGVQISESNVLSSESKVLSSESKVQSLEPGPLDADILWLFNLTTGAGIWSHDAAHSSILIHGDYLYVNTSTGVDNTHKRIRTPDAPSLVVLDKRTGRFLARENEHIAPNIFHNTWSSPSLAEVNGKPLVFFGAGNGILYAFEPLPSRITEDQRLVTSHPTMRDEVQTLNKVWQFDFDPAGPKTNVHKYNTNRREGPSNFYGMPVFHQNRIYAAGGGDIWWGKNEAWLKCIDATRTGDITTNGLVWSYPLQKHVLSTPAVSDGLVFIADCGRLFHCVDATTGKALWTHEIKGDVWASPLVADGKVYLGTRSGNFYIFEAGREKKVLSAIEVGNPISGTATAANGVLYVATMTRLYTIQKK
jgi:outer membrane protein assembly factor BamB